jgi:ABC-type transport system involved in multi-copper enzyme maturation permease subunit
MKSPWRDVLITTRHELSDAMRSRRAAVVILLYLAILILSFNSSISLLHRIEQQLAEALALAPGGAGSITQSLWESERFRRMMDKIVGGSDIARGLVRIPPLALLYGWLAFALTPVLVLLTTSTRIAEEVASGSVRFALFRTSRLAWVLGKFLGQALLVALAIGLSAAGAWSLARFRVPGSEPAGFALAMLLFAGKTAVLSLTFIGLSLGCSQLTRSPHVATVLSFLAWIVLGAGSFFAERGDGTGWSRVWSLLNLLTPGGHDTDLWRMDAPHATANLLFLMLLGLFYLWLGYARLSRRDL